VVVLNHNGERFLGPCLDSVLQQRDVEFDVIFVDNGSTDGSVVFVRQQFPAVRIIALGRNSGVAAGYNAGMQAVTGEFIVVLNNDTHVQAGWLRALHDAANTDPTIGAVSSLLCRDDQPDVIDSAGIALNVTGYAWDYLSGCPRTDAGLSARRVFGASAGAALYRRAMLLDVGMFDERFFAYLEDVELAWRARLRGWHAVVAPDAVVLHRHSATSGEGSRFKRWHLGRNRVWLLTQVYPNPSCWCYLPLIAGYDLLASVYHLLVWRDTSAVLGRVRGLRDLGPALRRRAEIQRNRTARWRDVRAAFSPLEGPRALRRRAEYRARPALR
jgi:GT2 family glycosyltransferase